MWVRCLQHLYDVNRERSLSGFSIARTHAHTRANCTSTLFFRLCSSLVQSMHQDANSAIWMPQRLSLPRIYRSWLLEKYRLILQFNVKCKWILQFNIKYTWNLQFEIIYTWSLQFNIKYTWSLHFEIIYTWSLHFGIIYTWSLQFEIIYAWGLI